jgi:hypothetical protein
MGCKLSMAKQSASLFVAMVKDGVLPTQSTVFCFSNF